MSDHDTDLVPVSDREGVAPTTANEPQATEWASELAASEAAALLAEAECIRTGTVDMLDPMGRVRGLAQARALEQIAARVISDPGKLRIGPGGEVVLTGRPDDPWPRREVARSTRTTPDALDAEATVERLTLARDARALPLALDAAERLGATSPMEQALSHQLAAAHVLAMRLATRANALLDRKFITYKPHLREAEMEARREQIASIEAARMATASAKLMEATARAATALDRLRNGSRQTIIVRQQVDVHDGGQAVVAGAMDASKGGDRGRR